MKRGAERGKRKGKGKSRQEKSCIPLHDHHKGGLGLACVGLSSILKLKLIRPFDLALVSAGSNVMLLIYCCVL